MTQVSIVSGDIAERRDDAIVNAWNRNILPWWLMATTASGVSGALRRAAGLDPFRELGRHPAIPLGEAVATQPGRLPVKAIIHVAGVNLLWRSSKASISRSTRNAVLLAHRMGMGSIAFPIIGSGTGAFSEQQALDIMVAELNALDIDLSATIVRFSR